MKYVSRSFFVFVFQTVILISILSGTLSLFPEQKLIIHDIKIKGQQSMEPIEWPIKVQNINNVTVRGIIKRQDKESTHFKFEMSHCPKKFFMNEDESSGKIQCVKSGTGLVTLSDRAQVGDNAFEMEFIHSDNLFVFDIFRDKKTDLPRITNVEYQLQDEKPVRTNVPLKLDLTKTYEIDFIMEIPLVHTDNYIMGVEGCIESLSINEKDIEGDYPICKQGVVRLGRYIHSGKNAVQIKISQAGHNVIFNLHSDPEDRIYFILKIFIMLSILAYGIIRFF